MFVIYLADSHGEGTTSSSTSGFEAVVNNCVGLNIYIYMLCKLINDKLYLSYVFELK